METNRRFPAVSRFYREEESPVRQLTVTTRGRDGCAVISLRGELDIASADELRRGLHAARRAHGDHLILDLDDLEFMDSHGLSVIINCHKAVTGHGSLALTGARPIVRRTLQITGLDRRLALYDTVEQAAASIRPPAQAAPSGSAPA